MYGSWYGVTVLLVSISPAVLLTGCGGGAETGETIQVTGKVVFDDAPLTDARVQFTSRRSGTAFPADLNDDGTFAIELLDVYPGEEFDVSVGAPLTDSEAPGDEPVELDAGGIPIAPPPPPVPPKYLEPTTSGLSARLAGESSQTFDFELTSG